MQIEKNYTIVFNILDLNRAVQHIQESDYLTFDVESTGLNVRKDKIIGFGFCGKIGEAYYIPMYKWDVKNEKLINIDQYSKTILNLLRNKDLIMHNGSYDVRITKNDLDIDLKNNLVADTILMWHTICEEGPFGLKTICAEIQDKIGYDAEDTATKEKEEMVASIKANGGSTTQKNYEMYKANLDKIGYYCCADVDMTLRLFEHCYDVMEKDEWLIPFFFDDEVMPLYKEVTIGMEDKPVKLDMPYIEENYIDLLDKLNYYKTNVIEKLKITEEFDGWLKATLDNKVKVSPKGKFGQQTVVYFKLDLPTSEKTGKYSLGKKVVESNVGEGTVRDFLLGKGVLLPEDEYNIKYRVYLADNDDVPINISSKAQMGDLVFNHYNIEPLSYTKEGNPQFNATFVEHLAELDIEWAKELKIYNRLSKIKSAYFDRFLENNEDGYYYFSYKQHGTISGRYGSDAQQLPRPMEDGEDHPDVVYFSNMVRRFFIAGEGRLFVDADFESLEPHVFAHVSGDERLRDIFRKGHDFYSTIAIVTENIEGVSADKKADNYLGKVNKPLRQSAKAYSLGIPYGLGGYALGKTLEISTEEAEELIEGYLSGFPNLKKWMDRSKYLAQTKGYVTSEAGRVRHLPKVKDLYSKHKDRLLDFKYRNKLISQYRKKGVSKKEATDMVTGWYLDYKNGVNNARNFQIQSLAGSVVNRAMVAMQRYFNDNNIDAWVCGTVHDQIIVNVPSNMANDLSKVVEDYMTNTYKLSLDLKSPPEIGDNWRDTH